MEQKIKQIKIQASKDELKGVYSNLMQVTHSQEEFVIDFINVVGSTGALVSRVIVSPLHFKRMINALESNLKIYEGRFGKIAQTEGPKREVGFGT